MQTNIYGKRSEVIASDYLKKKGYKILELNYKNKVGEIDIIAKDKDYIVFVEVKARMSQAFGHHLKQLMKLNNKKSTQLLLFIWLKIKNMVRFVDLTQSQF